jgi:hypothetical protein
MQKSSLKHHRILHCNDNTFSKKIKEYEYICLLYNELNIIDRILSYKSDFYSQF